MLSESSSESSGEVRLWFWTEMDVGSKRFWWRFLQGGALSCGMGDGQEQEERLKEVFESFDASGCGSLTPEELADLCRSLQLEDATPALLHAVLQDQDRPTARVRGFSS